MATTAASAGCSSGFRVSGNGRNRKDTSRSSAIRRTAYSATIFRRRSASPGRPSRRKSRNSSESWSTSRSSNSTPTGRKNQSPRVSPDSVPFPINWNTSTCTTCCRCKVMLKYRLHRWRGILFNHSSCTSSSNIPRNGINSRGSQKFETAAAGAQQGTQQGQLQKPQPLSPQQQGPQQLSRPASTSPTPVTAIHNAPAAFDQGGVYANSLPVRGSRKKTKNTPAKG